MKRTAVIQSGRVLNVIAGDADPAAFPPGCTFVDVTALPVGPGDHYIAGEFVRVTATTVREITPRQARLALHAAGTLASVQAFINALPDEQRTAAQIEWEYATTVRQDHPLVQAVAQQLGKTDAEIAALFDHAATL